MAFPALSTRLARIQRDRPPLDLVENKVTFGAEDASFSVYDTVRPAERVPLAADNPLYCGMVTGKKVVHTASGAALPFLPLESLVVPSGHTIEIDFPGASDAAPTTCLAIEIDRAKVRRVAERLNETTPRSTDSGDWRYADDAVCHFENTPGIEHTVHQLVGLFVDDDPDKDVLIDLGVQELVVRMLRVEARKLLLEESAARAAQHGLAAAAELAKRRLGDPIKVADLAAAACMSEPSFYRAFRNEFGTTPMAYLTDLRVERARQLLGHRGRSVTDIAAAVGFGSVSHFIRVYRSHVGRTPKQDQIARRAAA
ncbi:AraC family transcriptional regulator [Rubrivirga sp.]|uniref:AraC family transcriptional regulator n=1 Tax=Rubrivirga sp. TaxID=1885344 RepID=UPI003C7915B8